MELTSEEWLNIKDWLNELYVEYNEKAEINVNYKLERFYREECSNIKAFLDTKRQ